MTKKSKMKRADKNNWPGVYCYETNQKVRGKPDVCFYITYKIDGKKIWEKIGLKSEGYTAPVAFEVRSKRIREKRHCGEVKTAKEIREEFAIKNRTLDYISEEYFKQRGGTDHAKRIDQGRYNNHVKQLIGKKTIGQLCVLDMKRIEKEMKGMAPATIWGALEITRRIINFGFRTGMCPRLDFVIKMPQRNNEVVEYLQPEEVARLMDVLDNWPNKPAVRIIRTAMLTGMRRGEIFKLEKRDLDFIQKAITLRNPKGGKTVSIPMNQAVRGLFQEQLADNNKHFPDSPYVFPGIDGRQRKQCSAAKRIKEAAGLPKSFRMFHGLRHHFAVTLANSGKVSLDMIGELLTHKSIDMTRRYAQFLPDTKREASDTATELFEIQRTTGEKFLDSGQKENPSVG